MSEATTVLAGIKDHLAQIETKLEDIYTVHLPAVREFAHTLEANPLVTAFAASIPGELSGDAMAILNGLVPLLGALGGHIARGPDPTPAVPVTPPGPVLAPVPAAVPPAPAGDSNGQ